MIIDHKKKVLDDTVLWLEARPIVRQVRWVTRGTRTTCLSKIKNFFQLLFWPRTVWQTFVIMMALVLLKPRLFLNCRLFQAWSNASEALGYSLLVLHRAINVK